MVAVLQAPPDEYVLRSAAGPAFRLASVPCVPARGGAVALGSASTVSPVPE